MRRLRVIFNHPQTIVKTLEAATPQMVETHQKR
jgi:hypothetical protein